MIKEGEIFTAQTGIPFIWYRLFDKYYITYFDTGIRHTVTEDKEELKQALQKLTGGNEWKITI